MSCRQLIVVVTFTALDCHYRRQKLISRLDNRTLYAVNELGLLDLHCTISCLD